MYVLGFSPCVNLFWQQYYCIFVRIIIIVVQGLKMNKGFFVYGGKKNAIHVLPSSCAPICKWAIIISLLQFAYSLTAIYILCMFMSHGLVCIFMSHAPFAYSWVMASFTCEIVIAPLFVCKYLLVKFMSYLCYHLICIFNKASFT